MSCSESLVTEVMGKSSEANNGVSYGDQPEVEPVEAPGLCDCKDCLQTNERSETDVTM